MLKLSAVAATSPGSLPRVAAAPSPAPTPSRSQDIYEPPTPCAGVAAAREATVDEVEGDLTVQGVQPFTSNYRDVIDAPLYAVAAVLNDRANAKAWVPWCVESEVRQAITPVCSRGYMRTRKGYGIRDRDVVTDSELKRIPAHLCHGRRGIVCLVRSVPGQPEVAECARVLDTRGRFILRELPNGKTQVEHTISADLGHPKLPKLALSLVVGNQAKNSVLALAKRVAVPGATHREPIVRAAFEPR